MKKNIKKILTSLLIFILIFSISSEIFKVNTEAYTIKCTITYRLVKKKKVKKPSIGKKSDYVYIGQMYDVYLDNTNKKGISWSVSNKKVLKIVKKNKNKVTVKGLKAGTSYVRARYKGKTYQMKMKVRGHNYNIMRVLDEPDKNDNLPLKIKSVELHMSDGEPIYNEWVFIEVPDLDPITVSYYIEDDSICEAEWDKKWTYYNDGSGKTGVYLNISPLSLGKTRIKLTNSYNKKEVHYINVDVKEFSLW